MKAGMPHRGLRTGAQVQSAQHSLVNRKVSAEVGAHRVDGCGVLGAGGDQRRPGVHDGAVCADGRHHRPAHRHSIQCHHPVPAEHMCEMSGLFSAPPMSARSAGLPTAGCSAAVRADRTRPSCGKRL